MIESRTLAGRDRAVSSSVTHALALGITAILISGLLISASTLLEDQRQNSAREQLRTVGNRIADDLSRAAALAQDGGNVTFRSHQPTTIAGRSYQVKFLTGSPCDTDLFTTEACLNLELEDRQATVMVPVRNETAVSFEPRSGGAFVISATANGSATPPTVPRLERDLSVGVSEDVGSFTSGSAVNLTNRDPIAGFTFTPGQPSVESIVHFENDTKDLDGVIASYEWDLDNDGTTDKTSREFDYSFPSPGKYNVTLTVTDNDGETDQVSKIISVGGLVYQPPATADNFTGTSRDAAIDFSIKNEHGADVTILDMLVDPNYNGIDRLGVPDPEKEVSIDGDLADDEVTTPITIMTDGRIIDLSNDGTTAQLSPGYTADVRLAGFQQSGTYVDMGGQNTFVAIRYRVNGSYYTSQFTLFEGTPTNQPPDPSFDVDCSDAPDCDFSDTSNDDTMPLLSWEWKFGDGTTSTAQDPGTHTFPRNGTYDVSLRVTDQDGVSSTVTKTVLVGDQPPPVVFAVNAGGKEVTANGVTYERDRQGNPNPYFTGDNYDDSTGDTIQNTTDQDLYSTMRWADWGGYSSDPGSFGYDVPVANGEYQVTLRLAELRSGGWMQPGYRQFDVELEGSPRVTNIDVYGAVGDDYSYDLTGTVDVTDETLNIEFLPDTNTLPPILNAMEVRLVDAVSYKEDASPDEQVVMEAEHHDGPVVEGSGEMSSDDWVPINDGSASNGKALDAQPDNGDSAGDTTDGPRLDYYVDFAHTGTYYVWVRMNCPSVGSAADSIHVGIDGQPATFGGTGLDRNATTKCNDVSGWMWASYAAGSQAHVDVTEKGQHTINVWMNDDGVQIDKIVLTTKDDGTYTPSGEGPPTESPQS